MYLRWEDSIKANITQTIGQYKWAMSSYNFESFHPGGLSLELGSIHLEILHPRVFPAVNFELIEITDFSESLSESEQQEIDAIFTAKLEIKEDEIVKKEIPSLGSRFDFLKNAKSKNLTHYNRDLAIAIAIANAIQDGYTQSEIAKFLKLSGVAISKIYKIYKQKVKLFDKLRDKGIFWSYSKDISYKKAGESLTIEYLLKYGDFDDIRLGFELFGKRVMKKVWEEKLKCNKQFIKLNVMIARLFFGMDVESDYFKEVKNERFEKLKLLAS